MRGKKKQFRERKQFSECINIYNKTFYTANTITSLSICNMMKLKSVLKCVLHGVKNRKSHWKSNAEKRSKERNSAHVLSGDTRQYYFKCGNYEVYLLRPQLLVEHLLIKIKRRVASLTILFTTPPNRPQTL